MSRIVAHENINLDNSVVHNKNETLYMNVKEKNRLIWNGLAIGVCIN